MTSGDAELTSRILNTLQPYTSTRFVAFPDNQSRPVVTANTSVRYPPERKRRDEEGKVLLLLLIDAEGDVANVFVIDSTGRDFSTAAALSMIRWKFKPAKIDQVAVPVLTTLPVTFTIND